MADSPSTRRALWNPAEDAAILAAVREHGTDWERVSSTLHNRTADAVRNRWHRLCQTGIAAASSGSHARQPTAWIAWTRSEDEYILRNGASRKWREIAAQLPGRSDSSVRNRYARLTQGDGPARSPAPSELPSDGGEDSLPPLLPMPPLPMPPMPMPPIQQPQQQPPPQQPQQQPPPQQQPQQQQQQQQHQQQASAPWSE